MYRLFWYSSNGRKQTLWVSLLKIEPWSQFFRQYKPILAYIIYATVKSLWREHSFTFFRTWLWFVFTLLLTFILKNLDASSHLWCLLAKNQACSLDFSSNSICFCRFYYSYYCKKSMGERFLVLFRFDWFSFLNFCSYGWNESRRRTGFHC